MSTPDGATGPSAAATTARPAARPGPWARVVALTGPGHGWVPVAVAGFLLLGTRQSFTVPYTGLGLSPAQLLLLLLALVWVLTRLLGRRDPAGLGVLSGLLVLRVCVVLISYGVSTGRVLTPAQRSSSDQVVVVEVVAAVVVVVVVVLLRTTRDLELVLRALVLGGALSGALAVVDYLTGVDLGAVLHLPGLRETIPEQGVGLVRQGVTRAAGAAAQPLELAAVATTLLPVAAALFFAARGRGARAWPWAAAAALLAAGGVVSLSRSVFVALAVAGVVVALRWPVRRVAAVVGALAVAAVAALLSGSRVVSALTTLLTQGSDDFSLGSRQVGRDYAFSRLAAHLWWGQGPGTYDVGPQPVLDNQYLSHLVETGLLGLLTAAGVVLCALAYALRATARDVEPRLRELAVGIAGALVVLLVVQLVLDTAGFVQISVLTYLCLGLAGAVWRLGVGPLSGSPEIRGLTHSSAEVSAEE